MYPARKVCFSTYAHRNINVLTVNKTFVITYTHFEGLIFDIEQGSAIKLYSGLDNLKRNFEFQKNIS